MQENEISVLTWTVDEREFAYDLREEEVLVGRDELCSLVLNQRHISRRHANLTLKDGVWYVEDLESSQGTTVNGVRLEPHRPRPLRQGDEIQLGKQVVLFGKVPDTEPKKKVTKERINFSMKKMEEEYAEYRKAAAAHISASIADPQAADKLRGLLEGELEHYQTYVASKFREYELLQEITQIITGILEVKRLLSTALQLVSDAIHADRGFIILYDHRAGELRSMIPRHFNREDNSAREYDFTFSQTIARNCFESKEIIIIEDALRDERFSSAHSIMASSIRSVVCIPLGKGNETTGVIYLDNLKDPGVFHEHQTDFLRAFSAQTALALENARLYTQAVTDSLTGLYNRKFINERIFEEMVRCRRYGRSCGLILLDIDHFKKVNDTHGHGIGDKVIERVAEILRENARTSDVVARYGGEEFLMLLTETDEQGARILAERVRESVEESSIAVDGKEIHVTVSSGVAGYKMDFLNKLAAFVAEADKALYRAKDRGRNRVCVAGQT